MMLGASIAHANLIGADISGIGGTGSSGLPHGADLIAFAEAAVVGQDEQLSYARRELIRTAGHEVMIDTAAVVANFEMMTRIADTTGAAVNEAAGVGTAGARSALGLDAFASVRWG
jgi:hypothetical protein